MSGSAFGDSAPNMEETAVIARALLPIDPFPRFCACCLVRLVFIIQRLDKALIRNRALLVENTGSGHSRDRWYRHAPARR